VIGVAAVGLILAPVTPACACSCVGETRPEELAEGAAIVFVGIVHDIDAPFQLLQGSADPVTVRFDVTEVHKGDVPERISVVTARDGASCGYPFRAGGQYLVFAQLDGSGSTTHLTTGLCAGNRDLATEPDPFPAGRAPSPAPPWSDSSVPIIVAGAAAVLGAAAITLIIWRRRRRPSRQP
jgi:hypothetical protein